MDVEYDDTSTVNNKLPQISCIRGASKCQSRCYYSSNGVDQDGLFVDEKIQLHMHMKNNINVKMFTAGYII